MPIRSLTKAIAKPARWALGLDKPDSFANVFRQCRHTFGVSREFLESPSARLVNPQQRQIKSDTVSLSLPASRFSGLSDEKILVLFTKGFFGGWAFYLESLALKAGVWRLSPVTFTGFEDKPHRRDIWSQADIPKTELLSVGDTLFRTFKLIDVHLGSSLDPRPSYLDFGFGQNQSSFAGCHHVRISRNRCDDDRGTSNDLGTEFIDFGVEGFIYDPQSVVFDRLGWFHTFYVQLLFSNGVQACLQR